MIDKSYYSNNDVKALVLEIARQLQKDKWMPDYIVGLTRGGLTPAVMLSHYLDVPMNTLKISLRDDNESSESNCWMAEDAFNQTNILVVDDINDTGATLKWVMEDWQAGCHPNSEKWDSVWNNNVKFATLIDNQSSDYLDVDYIGKTINKMVDDEWICFPWETWWQS
jgi:hypoxanthine phosphoribosyltransferase